MHRLLERLDGAASTIVPLLYLVGLALGAASYFAGVTFVSAHAGLAVGVALATAAELHSFLQQRRVRAVWAQLQRLPDDADHAAERDALVLQLKVNAGILAGLLAFSAFNAIAFVAATWRPIPSFLPGWVQIGIRGLVIPALFFAAGFLAPLHADAGDQLRATSMDMLRRTLKAIGKQWRQRLAAAQKRHADLAPIAIALLEDVGDTDGARRVQLIAAGLDATTMTTIAGDRREATLARVSAGATHATPIPPTRAGKVAVIASYEGASAPALAQMGDAPSDHFEASAGLPTATHGGADMASKSTLDDVPDVAQPLPTLPDDDPPPSGKGSPAVASKRTQGTNVTPLRRGMGKPPRRDRRVVNRANARSGRRGTAEARVRAAFASRPELTDEQLMRVAQVSSSTVSKWRRVIEAEQQGAIDALNAQQA